jgi:hypothetical protein
MFHVKPSLFIKEQLINKYPLNLPVANERYKGNTVYDTAPVFQELIIKVERETSRPQS